MLYDRSQRQTRNYQNHSSTRKVPIIPPMPELLAEIEGGVDVATPAQWRGQKDGGALLLKRYRKESEDHSLKMAEKFTATGKATV